MEEEKDEDDNNEFLNNLLERTDNDSILDKKKNKDNRKNKLDKKEMSKVAEELASIKDESLQLMELLEERMSSSDDSDDDDVVNCKKLIVDGVTYAHDEIVMMFIH